MNTNTICTILIIENFKMGVNELTNKLRNTLNKLINGDDLSVKTTGLSDELLKTLGTVENCTTCKDKKMDGNDFDEFNDSINKMENCLTKLKKEERFWTIYELKSELFRMDNKLNKILCEGCKGKEIRKLADKCGN